MVENSLKDKRLICNFTDLNKNDNLFSKEDATNQLSSLWKCDWLKLINQPFIIKYFENNLEEIIDVAEYDIFLSAQAFLLAFVQENFCGPNLPEEYRTFLNNNWPKNVNAVEQLKVDTEELNPNVHYPEFLLTAKLLLQQIDKNYSETIVNWWKIRLIFVHQSVLEELTNSLFIEINTLVDFILKYISQINDIELETLLLLEIIQLYLVFNHVYKVENVLDKIYEKIGIQLSVGALLGVRTKFQQKPLPQLFLRIYQENDKFLSSKETNESTKLPKLLKLDDEVRLEKVKFVSQDDNQVLDIPSIVQILIFIQTKLLLKSQPKDCLADEIIEPYLTTLLEQEYGPLNVRLASLILNIKQEANHKRTVERSLKQCEEVLKIINDSKYDIKERLSYGFAPLIPKWEIQKQLGDLMISLGLVKSALDLYIEIQSWENVINCYTRLELKHKAAEVIQNELKKKETVKLYCLLGDATDDPKYYEIAWKLSKETSGLAQRHWGSYYFAKKEYEKAMPHFEKSLEINSLQEILWLRAGYSALMLENWDVAAQCYLRYTHIDPNSFESWNNLAKALIKTGDKKRAQVMLCEAIKCNYNNWKIWENLMNVSIDIASFEDAISAYNRIIELKDKEKFIDLEVLELLVNAVIKNLPDADGRSTDRLRKKLNQLLAHQCVTHSYEPKVWEFSAYLAETTLSRAQKLQKSYRAYVREGSSWAKDKEKCLKIMNLCKDLCKCSLHILENYNELGQSEKSNVLSQISSARLTVKGCVRAVEDNVEQWDDETKLLLEELKLYVDKTTEEVKIHLSS